MGNAVAKNQMSMVSSATSDIVNKALMSTSNRVAQSSGASFRCCCVGDIDISTTNTAQTWTAQSLTSDFKTEVTTQIAQRGEQVAKAINANLFPVPGSGGALASDISDQVMDAMTSIANISVADLQSMIQQSSAVECSGTTAGNVTITTVNTATAGVKAVMDATASSKIATKLSTTMKQSATAVSAQGGAMMMLAIAAVVVALIFSGTYFVTKESQSLEKLIPVILPGGLAAFLVHKKGIPAYKQHKAAMAQSHKHSPDEYPPTPQSVASAEATKRNTAEQHRLQIARGPGAAGDCTPPVCGDLTCSPGKGCVVPSCPTGTSWRVDPVTHKYGCIPISTRTGVSALPALRRGGAVVLGSSSPMLGDACSPGGDVYAVCARKYGAGSAGFIACERNAGC
jgi:hypothetical protein